MTNPKKKKRRLRADQEAEAQPVSGASSKKKEEMTIDRALRLVASSVNKRRQWRTDAKQDFRFVAGDQWATDDKTEMDKKLRPRATFNEIGPIADAIVGHEIANRQEVCYYPRQVGAAGVSDTLTAAAQWVRQTCDAEQEESDAFYDCTVCGEGWTDTEIDYDQDLDGRIEECRVDPLEMDVDPLSERKNYADAKWVARTKVYPRDEAKELWPQGKFEAATSKRTADEPVDVIAAAFYHADSGKKGRKQSEDSRVAVHDFQWWEHETVYRVPLRLIPPEVGFQILHGFAMEQAEDEEKTRTTPPEDRPMLDPDRLKPDANGLLLFTGEDWDKVKDLLEAAGVEPLEQQRRVYKRMYFSAREELERTETPAADSFTYKAMTAKRDRHARCWYGLVRNMKDPQTWTNKFMSSALETLAYSAKGGMLYKAKVFEDIRAAEEDWADPSKNIEVSDEANLQTDVFPRPVNQVPQGMFSLMDYARQRIPATAGVNAEVMGLSQAMDPSGVLEEGRRQQGLNMLSYLFDALRLYRKEQGRLLLTMIKRYIPAGRLIRVTGPEGAQYVPLVYDAATIEYDVEVDEAPTAPDVKQRTWDNAMQVAEHLPGAFPLAAMPLLLDYAPFPAALVEKLKKAAADAQAAAKTQPNPEAQLAAATAQEKGASAALKQAQAADLQGKSQRDQILGLLEMLTQKLRAEGEAARSQADVETSRLEAETARRSMPAKVVGSHADAIRAIAGAFTAAHGTAQARHRTLTTIFQPSATDAGATT